MAVSSDELISDLIKKGDNGSCEKTGQSSAMNLSWLGTNLQCHGTVDKS